MKGGRQRVSSTLKSLVFWMVLVIVAVAVWNFSYKFQTHEHTVAFSEFLADVDAGKVEKVTITGQEVMGTYKPGSDKEPFHTYAPGQYDGLANKLYEKGVVVNAKEP